ncbi:MAG: ABC transporter permease [Bacteroidales bacterium]|nr:ABC transporter permease [Bacteroidales bacterium]
MLRKMVPTINPIIVKELRSKMRGARPFITLTAMLVVLAGITYGIYRVAITVMANYSGTPISPQVGQAMFTSLSFLLMLFICIITPAETSGAISGEKEQLTYEMLLSTPMHPAKILSGKLFSSLSYIFLMLFAAIPIASLIFMFGGVSLRDMFKVLIVLIGVTITLGAFGILMSSLFQRSSRATIISYIIITLIIFGSLGIYIASGIFTNGNPPRWILAINPLSTLASAMTNPNNQYNSILGFIPFLGADLSTLSGNAIGISSIPRPLYHYSLPLYGFLSIVFYFIALRLVPPTKKWRQPRKDILIFLAAILILLALTTAGFYATTGRYEQATFDGSNQAFFAGPFIEKPFSQVVVAEEVRPAILEDNTVESSSLNLDNQISLYAAAITDFVETFSSDRNLTVEQLILVSTISETEQERSYSFALPEPMQLAIAAEISDLSPNITWVQSTEDGFKNPIVDNNPGDYVINMGDIRQVDNEHFTVSLAINIQGVVERQAEYTFVLSNSGSWRIESEEKVFDAKQTN